MGESSPAQRHRLPFGPESILFTTGRSKRIGAGLEAAAKAYAEG
jgi:hypothetical protein